MWSEVSSLSWGKVNYTFVRFSRLALRLPCCAYLRLIFSYTVPVWNLPQSRLCDFAVRCKGCSETIPAPVETIPDSWIVAQCPLCGSKRRYLPTVIFRGSLSHRLRSLRV